MNKPCAGMIVFCLAVSAPQARPQQEPGALQQKIRQIRDAMAGNHQKLHGYKWIETVTLEVDGTPRAPRRYLCRYGPDGELQRTSLDSQQGQSERQGGSLRGGGLVRMVVAKRKKEKYQKEIGQIRALTRLYMPLDPVKLRAAGQADEIALDRQGARGDTFVISNYAKPGDQFGITVDHSTMQIAAISLKSWLEKPKDSVIGQVRFDRLSDGTIYPALTTLNVSSGKLSMTIGNSDYSRPVD